MGIKNFELPFLLQTKNNSKPLHIILITKLFFLKKKKKGKEKPSYFPCNFKKYISPEGKGGMQFHGKY